MLPAIKSRFSLSDTPSLRCCWLQVKKAVIILECATAFLVLGHFYAVRCVVAKNKVFFIVYTPIIHLVGVWHAHSYTCYTPVRCMACITVECIYPQKWTVRKIASVRKKASVALLRHALSKFKSYNT